MKLHGFYYLCKKQAAVCRIIASGGDPTKHGTAEASVMARELIAIGVSPTDIITETNSGNTYENARFCAEIVRSEQLNNLILVTSGFHMTRSLRLFHSFNLDPTPAPSDRMSAHFSLIPLAQNIAMLDLALHEYGGMAQHFVYNLMGWNAAHSRK